MPLYWLTPYLFMRGHQIFDQMTSHKRIFSLSPLQFSSYPKWHYLCVKISKNDSTYWQMWYENFRWNWDEKQRWILSVFSCLVCLVQLPFIVLVLSNCKCYLRCGAHHLMAYRRSYKSSSVRKESLQIPMSLKIMDSLLINKSNVDLFAICFVRDKSYLMILDAHIMESQQDS